jgi:hypothetical protein
MVMPGFPEQPPPPPADDPDGPGSASPNSPDYNPDKDPFEGQHPPRPDGTPVPVKEP